MPDGPGVVVKPMFGNLGAFVNGNMFAGLFGPTVGVRVADEDRAALARVDGTGPFGPQGDPWAGTSPSPRPGRAIPIRPPRGWSGPTRTCRASPEGPEGPEGRQGTQGASRSPGS